MYVLCMWFHIGLSKYIELCCNKFTNLIDEMVRNSFAKQRFEWGGNGSKLLLYNSKYYKEVIAEVPDFPELVRIDSLIDYRTIKCIVNRNGKMRIMLLMVICIPSLWIL